MFYLIVTILVSLALNIVFKFASKRDTNRYAVTLFGNITVVIISLLYIVGEQLLDWSWFTSLFAQAGAVLFGGGVKFDLAASYGFAVLFGILRGALVFFALWVMLYSTAKNGAAMTGTINKISAVLPVVLAALCFGEVPGMVSSVGLILAICAILVVYLKKEEGTAITVRLALLGTFLGGGLGDFTNKIYQFYAQTSTQNMFVLYSYISALLVSAIMVLWKDKKVTRWDIWYGFLTGLPLSFLTRFTLRALVTLPGYVVFPTYAAANIIGVHLINLLFFHEKFSVRQYLAIGVMVVSIVLLNL